MPTILRLSDGSHMRQSDIGPIIRLLQSSRCVELTGFSNVGKSSLMRFLAHADVWLEHLGEEGAAFLPVYVDCNRMVEMTEQGFYELVLRCLRESGPNLAADPDLRDAYEGLVGPASDFQVPLSFSQGLTAALRKSQHKLILLFDEFDEPFQEIDERVFLNLRAKKDLYGSRLVFITATVLPLSELWPGDHSGEFGELFLHQPWHLGPFARQDVEAYVRSYSQHSGVELTAEDAAFVYHWAGGHPGYLAGVVGALSRAIAELDGNEGGPADRFLFHRSVAGRLGQDPTLLTESEKIWDSCQPGHQEALRLVMSGGKPDDGSLAQLMKRHILTQEKEGLRAFCRLFAEYVMQFQNAAPAAEVDSPAHEESLSSGEPVDSGHGEELFVDTDAWEVYVGDRKVPLTRQEYLFVKLLYEHRNRTVQRYTIIQEVWGDAFVEEVEDARVEKLVSRLRRKIEPDSGNPIHIITLRGWGYRLVTSR